MYQQVISPQILHFCFPLLVNYFGIYSHNIMPFVGAQEIGYVTQE
jgi:hypothetical protein